MNEYFIEQNSILLKNYEILFKDLALISVNSKDHGYLKLEKFKKEWEFIEPLILKQYNSELKKISSMIFLSTCSRQEVFIRFKDSSMIDYIKSIISEKAKMLPVIHVGSNSVRHILKVALGLGSPALFEFDVIEQLEESLKDFLCKGMVDKVLYTILRSAIDYSKMIRAKLKIEDYGGIPELAIRMLEERIGGLKGLRFLIIGSGHVAYSLVKSLKIRGVKEIFVSTNSKARIESIEKDLNVKGIHTQEVLEYINDIDLILISSPNVNDDLKTKLKEASERIPIVDLNMPRTFEHEIKNYIWLEDIEIYASSNIWLKDLVEFAEKILEEYVEKIAKDVASTLIDSRISSFASKIDTLLLSEFVETLKLSGISIEESNAKRFSHVASKKILGIISSALKSYAKENPLEALKIANKLSGELDE